MMGPALAISVRCAGLIAACIGPMNVARHAVALRRPRIFARERLAVVFLSAELSA